MGCPGKVKIGHTVVFSICTHDPDTGVLTDADSAPIYRLYEDETATPILTGSMAKLDDANTTGFYTELITCSGGNGFETSKTYTVLIMATVDSDQGGMCYAFKIVAAIVNNILEFDAVSTKTLTFNATSTKTLTFDAVSTKTLTIDAVR